MHGYTIVFDLDGTLVDTAPDLIGATNHALEGIGLAPVAGAHLRPWISYGARRMIVEALNVAGQTRSEFEVDGLLQSFLDYYETNIARESRPFPGAVATIERFKAEGATLAICTNKRERLSRALLEALAIDHLFAALAGRDTLPVSKPHPDHVLGAIHLAGGNPGRAVMVGDSSVDVEAARAACVPVVACTFGYSAIPASELGADATIDSYDALPRVLSGLTLARGGRG